MVKYDIIVIGAGAGGLNVAGFMNKAGFKVLLINKSDSTIGGDCLNYGCVPSKALIHISRLMYDAKEAGKFNMKNSGKVDMKKVDMKKVVKYIKDKQSIIRKHENAKYLRSIGIDVKLGKAKFTGKNKVEVNGEEHSAKKIVIATGSRPRELKLPGIEKVNLYNNESIFEIKELPKQLLVIGGGPIGIEIGQAFLRLGSEVTVIQNGSSFLPKEDSKIAAVLLQQLQKEGMKVYFNSMPKKFTSKDEAIIEDINKKKIKIKFDSVFVAIGRELNTEGLGLGEAGIEMDKGKIKVDKYLRTTNKKVMLCGDIAGSYQFTHAAELHAGIIISNFFSPFKKKVNYDTLSWVTYTFPEIATFGINEDEINKRGIKYERLEANLNQDDRAIVDDFTEGKLVLYVAKDKLLGGSMVAPNAGELFQELVLANSSGLRIKDLFSKIYAYPTAARINKTIISKHYAKKLTGFAKKMLKLMY